MMRTVWGRIKWFNRADGFGFVTVETLGAEPIDVMVHATALNRDGWLSLPPGADARIEVRQCGDKWRAERVLEVRLVH